MRIRITAIVSLLLALGGLAAPIPKPAVAPNKTVARPDPAYADITDDPKLPSVLLIGDSVSVGYTLAVRKELEGKANVHRPPQNCGSSAVGLANIEKWLGDRRWDVIHFNHHYVKDSELEYNRIAVEVMTEQGVQIDDLWAFAKPRLAEIQEPGNPHFTYKGSQVLAKEIARQIAGALK